VTQRSILFQRHLSIHEPNGVSRCAREIDVVPERYSGRGPQQFHEGDAHTGDNSFWVNAKDQLSLSLLALAKVQGRVIGSHD